MIIPRISNSWFEPFALHRRQKSVQRKKINHGCVSFALVQQSRAFTLKASQKLILLPNSKRWMLRPQLMSLSASRRRKRPQVAIVSALAVEKLQAWKDRPRLSVSRSAMGEP
jgi:hypothetical protein